MATPGEYALKLYILDGTPLSQLGTASPAPKAGDAVAYFRDCQAPGGKGIAALEKAGIEVVYAESLIGDADEDGINIFVDRFLRDWYHDKGREVGRAGPLSLGFLMAHSIVKEIQPGFLVRFGETCRHLFEKFPQARHVVTDIVDGRHPVTDLSPTAYPRRRFLEHLATTRGLGVESLPSAALPTFCKPQKISRTLKSLLVSYIGGLRPRYLAPKVLQPFRRKTRRRVYFFLNHGIRHAAESLARREDVEVYADQAGFPSIAPIRFDHFLPLPTFPLLRAAFQLRRHVFRMAQSGSLCLFNGLDYSPFLANALQEFCGKSLLVTAFKAAQAQRMWKTLKPDIVVINGEGHPQVRATISLDQTYGYRLVYIGHGLNCMPYGHCPGGGNYPNVTFVVPGEAHLDLWGRLLPKDRKPRRVILPTPVTTQVKSARGKRAKPSRGRVMILSYSPWWATTVTRMHLMDRYMIEILDASRVLLDKGLQVSFRPHVGGKLNHEYTDYMLNLTGMGGKIEIDLRPAFADALLAHDVVITNLSTCLYQSLYAGWPTIFYQPDFKRRQYTGILTAPDIKLPVATTPEELVDQTLEALDGNSTIARFPERFIREWSERFLGPDADRADELLADFLLREVEAPSRLPPLNASNPAANSQLYPR